MATYTKFTEIPLFKYSMIMADPPWQFEHWGEPNERSAGGQYKTMSLQEIKEIPISEYVRANSIVWMWSLPSMAHLVNEIFGSWHVTPVTSGYWVKTQKGDPSKPKMGLGHVLRDCGEPFFIGKIGRPRFPDNGIPSVIMAPRREHSRKPEQSYEYAERLAPKGCYLLDLFSRETRDGWDNFGDEATKFQANDGEDISAGSPQLKLET